MPEFHDRTVGQVDQFKAQPELEAKNIALEMENAKEESDLLEQIHIIRLHLKHKKLQEYQFKIRQLTTT